MCIILIGFQVHPHIPLMVAANRDEFYSRPAVAPTVVSLEPWVVAGRDELAGGTWLGMSAWGIAGLTNQPSRHLDPSSRSRGLLVLDALRAPDANAAIQVVEQQALDPGQPYNLFVATPERLQVAYRRADGIRLETLSPGWHVLPNGAADDLAIPKVQRAFELLRGVPEGGEASVLVQALRSILADHRLEPSAPDEPAWLPTELRRAVSAICVHSELYGTRSYSILMRDGRGGSRYWHGEGAPCTVGMKEVKM